MATTNTAAPVRPLRRARRSPARALLLSTLLAVAAAASTARAAIVQLDTGLPGADSDAILDGFPGLAPNDGTGDFGGNALAVSAKAGVTEERAFVELPLAPLVAAGATPDNVVEAILTFNIDDVLTTFGPGTDFDGTAGERILIGTYAGDGLVDLDDYPGGVLAVTIQTGPHGAITDASVRDSGPIRFSADLTERVKSLLEQSATHIGISFSTDDNPTGTSIDDLGDGGSGAPGTNGAVMPFLVVRTADATPTPVPTGSPAATVAPTPTTPGATPSPAPTALPTPTPSGGPGATPTPPLSTVTPGATSGVTPTPAQGTPQPTGVPTPPGGTPTPGASGTPGATATPSGSGTPGPSTSPGPSGTPGATLTPQPGASPIPSGEPQPTATPQPIQTRAPGATATPNGNPATPMPTGAAAPAAAVLPDGSGDQLVFYYDARDSFTTFLNLHNLGARELDVRIVLYDASLAEPFEEALVLAPGATRTLDVGALRAGGLPARAGAAFASAVDELGTPLVTRALAGNFTIANLATSSAWGAPAAARRAVVVAPDGDGVPQLGAPIDGSVVRLRDVRPDRLFLPVYYDPQTLEPAELGGNQLVFFSFADPTGAAVSAAATTWSIAARRSDGTDLVADPVLASGVVTSHLEALLGAAANGAAGSVTFTTDGGAPNRLIFFSESLGTFATGYLLPPVAPRASGKEQR